MTCVQPSDCCSNVCSGGSCGTNSCAGLGQSCSASTPCCGLGQCKNGVCGTACKAAGGLCAVPSDCCSNTCSNGACQ
jgi:hypothetical protein